jgi:outer membrane murein-binding lipoprotein Lpp
VGTYLHFAKNSVKSRKSAKEGGTMQCIKCGREIPDGELFCADCSRGPVSEKETERRSEKASARAATKPTPKSVPKPAAKPAPKAAPQRVARRPRRLIAAVVILSLLLAGSLGCIGWGVLNYRTVRTQLQVRDADLTLRERDLEAQEAEYAAANEALAEAKAEIERLEAEIESLKEQLAGTENTYYQSQYDQQVELLHLATENETLCTTVDDLESRLSTLESQLSAATARAQTLQSKADFLDTYAVFVENDGTNYYHTYSCPSFKKQSFWIYSRKLAESYGFSPCPSCSHN